jgi:hypothetical protein
LGGGLGGRGGLGICGCLRCFSCLYQALSSGAGLFDTEAARHHFAEYLTRLMVAERKTVSGINRAFS